MVTKENTFANRIQMSRGSVLSASSETLSVPICKKHVNIDID